jgi:hypothetical protein
MIVFLAVAFAVWVTSSNDRVAAPLRSAAVSGARSGFGSGRTAAVQQWQATRPDRAKRLAERQKWLGASKWRRRTLRPAHKLWRWGLGHSGRAIRSAAPVLYGTGVAAAQGARTAWATKRDEIARARAAGQEWSTDGLPDGWAWRPERRGPFIRDVAVKRDAWGNVVDDTTGRWRIGKPDPESVRAWVLGAHGDRAARDGKVCMRQTDGGFCGQPVEPGGDLCPGHAAELADPRLRPAETFVEKLRRAALEALARAEAGKCIWITGDNGRDFTECGNPALPDLVFCRDHLTIHCEQGGTRDDATLADMRALCQFPPQPETFAEQNEENVRQDADASQDDEGRAADQTAILAQFDPDTGPEPWRGDRCATCRQPLFGGWCETCEPGERADAIAAGKVYRGCDRCSHAETGWGKPGIPDCPNCGWGTPGNPETTSAAGGGRTDNPTGDPVLQRAQQTSPAQGGNARQGTAQLDIPDMETLVHHLEAMAKEVQEAAVQIAPHAMTSRHLPDALSFGAGRETMAQLAACAESAPDPAALKAWAESTLAACAAAKKTHAATADVIAATGVSGHTSQLGGGAPAPARA